jgi:hypothetical protein
MFVILNVPLWSLSSLEKKQIPSNILLLIFTIVIESLACLEKKIPFMFFISFNVSFRNHPIL